MEELDFSEEACIKRYVTYAYFEEDTEDTLHIEDIRDDDSIFSGLHIFVAVLTLIFSGIAVGWTFYNGNDYENGEYMNAAAIVYLFWLFLKWLGRKISSD